MRIKPTSILGGCIAAVFFAHPAVASHQGTSLTMEALEQSGFDIALRLPAPDDTLPTPDIPKQSIQVDGHSRTFYLYRPSNAPKRPSVVVALHGGRGNPEGFTDGSSLFAQADEHGFILVFPNSFDGNWNDGRDTLGGRPDDVRFMRAIVDWLGRKENIDRSRVYFTGHSNGGAMSHKVSCDAPS